MLEAEIASTGSDASVHREKIAVARLSVYSNSLLVALKLVVGVLMGSVAVISEALHSMIDLVAAVIARYSVVKASQPADREHRFGHGKFENLSGMIEGALIFVAAAAIIHEAVDKIRNPTEVEQLSIGMALMGLSALINFAVSRKLYRVAQRTESLALEADACHLRTDVWTSLGVMAGCGLLWITGWHWLDPAVAIGVALLIIRAAYDITARSTEGLLDKSLPEDEIQLIEKIMTAHNNAFVDFHELRARRTGSQRQIDLHLTVHRNLNVKESHDLVDHLERDIREALPRSEVLIHIEPCPESCNRCRLPAVVTDQVLGIH